MMKTITIKSILFLFTLTLFSSSANAFVELDIEKKQFLKYEPVYIEIRFDTNAIPDGFYISDLRDSKAEISLLVVDPSGKKSVYSAPIQVSRFKEETDFTFYETLLLSRNNFLFGTPGAYVLVIVDRNSGAQISNSLVISIVDATGNDDRYIQDEIEKHPSDYAMFVYLEGGDQFSFGKKIVEEMFKRKTGYHTVAGSILAINSSQIKYDWKNNRIERDKDIAAVKKYFPENSVTSYQPKHLKLEVSRMVMDNFSDTDIPDDLKNKIKEVAKKYNKEVKGSRRYESLKQM